MLTWDVCWEPSSDTYPCLLHCMVPKVLEQTLSPLWDELLVFDQLIVDGRREHLQQEPPLVIINVFDHNKFVRVVWDPLASYLQAPLLLFLKPSPPGSWSLFQFCVHLACSLQGPAVFLGRALAAPRVKLIEDPYQRPELQFFPLRKGPRAAGELIATFELIELDYSGRLEVRVLSPSWHELWTPLIILSGCPAPGNIEHGHVSGLPESLVPRECRLKICPRVISLDLYTPGNTGSRHILGSPCQASNPREPRLWVDPHASDIHPLFLYRGLFPRHHPPTNPALPRSFGFIFHQQLFIFPS